METPPVLKKNRGELGKKAHAGLGREIKWEISISPLLPFFLAAFTIGRLFNGKW
jgi:hypothetical protein